MEKTIIYEKMRELEVKIRYRVAFKGDEIGKN